MLILEHNVLEVILLAFMDQLKPFLNGKFGLCNLSVLSYSKGR